MFAELFLGEGNGIIHDGNVPIHTPKLLTGCREEYSSEVDHIIWPPPQPHIEQTLTETGRVF